MSGVDATVAGLLRASGLTLAVAESCSGGLIAKRLTDIPGSSAYFLLGTVTYADTAKVRVLSVPADMLAQYGAVSAEVAAAMAEGVRLLADSDLALATTGIAGPGGGSADKPVGTVFIAIAAADGCRVLHRCFAGDREMVREATAEAALQLLASRLTDTQKREGIA